MTTRALLNLAMNFSLPLKLANFLDIVSNPMPPKRHCLIELVVMTGSRENNTLLLLLAHCNVILVQGSNMIKYDSSH
jgi:hypothetical protein